MKRRPLVLSLAAITISATALLAWQLWPGRAPDPPSPEVTELQPASAVPAEPLLQTIAVAIRKRDTIIAALLRHDVPAVTAHALAAALRDAGANLRQIRPGDQIELTREPTGRLVGLAYRANPWLRFEVAERADGWAAVRIAAAPEVRVEVRQGEVGTSLWDAVESGALTANALLGLVQVFESEFDFTGDTQPGDRFRVLVETRYADGAFVDQARILAAQYISGGTVMTGIGFEDQGRFKYYDADGRSLKKMFLRSPLEFSRISSGFTYRRPHPILGGVRPHLAIDYAAPTGTPVWAVADGVVVFAGRKGGNGIQVRLQHRGGYETYYNHLSSIARGVRRGARVSQKQVIGRVGSTGLSTGPHLDYRVAYKGTFVNPLNEKFLPGDPIAPPKRDEFRQHASALLDRLEREAPGI
jgi:murein DD-endopeptidase MepM/ murein hydrolase activator NlpD